MCLAIAPVDPKHRFFWALNEEERPGCIPGWANIGHYSTFANFCTPLAYIFLTLGGKNEHQI